MARLLLFSVSLLTSAAAQETPVCGPPGEEVPATIVGAGHINGTPGDDVIVGSPGVDHINGGPGNDVICGEGGNDDLSGGPGDDELIGDELDLPPFLPSNGNNDDHLDGGPGNDVLAGVGGNDTLAAGPGDDQLIGFGGDDEIDAGPGDDTAFGGQRRHDVRRRRQRHALRQLRQRCDHRWGRRRLHRRRQPVAASPGGPPFPPGGNFDDCTAPAGDDLINNCGSRPEPTLREARRRPRGQSDRAGVASRLRFAKHA